MPSYSLLKNWRERPAVEQNYPKPAPAQPIGGNPIDCYYYRVSFCLPHSDITDKPIRHTLIVWSRITRNPLSSCPWITDPMICISNESSLRCPLIAIPPLEVPASYAQDSPENRFWHTMPEICDGAGVPKSLSCPFDWSKPPQYA